MDKKQTGEQVDTRPSMTAREKEVMSYYMTCLDKTQTAKHFGVSRTAIRKTVQRVERKGHAPWSSNAVVPDTYNVSKRSSLYRANGELINEWVMMHPTAEGMQELVSALCDRVKGMARVPTRKARRTDSDDVLFELDIYDAHIGMYATKNETNDSDYDCDIAARRMIDAAESLAARSGRPKEVVIVFGGDMQHSDNRNNKTELSENALDVDTRYHRVVQYVRAACQDVVQIGASIAEKVRVVVLEGNHSWHSEVWLAQVLDAFYSECENVTVELCESPRKKYVWGNNLLVWAHGDRIQPQKWPLIIAAEFPKEWGQTTFRHLKLGHIHHKKSIAPVMVDEQSGILVEYLEALCPSDAWHSSMGFVGSQRGASAFEYHRKSGLLTRFFHPVL